jgi:hypothetical protein
MAEAGSPRKRDAQPAPAPDVISESNIAEVEKEALERVNRTIILLEDALARWDNASEKPSELGEQAKRYRRLLVEFNGWARSMLLAKNSDDDFNARLGRLREFIAICRDYERGE